MTQLLNRRGFITSTAAATLVGTGAAAFTPQRTMFLTYDDGPDWQNTPQLLVYLSIYQMRATFFVMGQKIARNTDSLRKMAADGHQIGNHSWSHPDLGNASKERILSEIDRTNAAIAEVTGRMPTLFRPPYGSLSPAMTRMVRDERGMKVVLWDVDTLDWQRPGVVAVQNRVLSRLGQGRVVLMHDIHRDTVSAAPEIFAGMQRAGIGSVGIA